MPAPGAPTLPGTVERRRAPRRWRGRATAARPGPGSVSSYNLTATNGVFPATGQSTAAFGPNDRSGQVQVADDSAGQTLIVTYTVTCSGGTRGRADSAPSGEATSPIQPPEPTPTPTPTPCSIEPAMACSSASLALFHAGSDRDS